MRDAEPVVAIAASAGGVGSLGVVLRALPPDLAAAVVVVLHLDPDHPTHIATVLARASSLPVHLAEAGERLQPGQVAVAPPDRHLLVGSDLVVELGVGPQVHFLRPSADLLLTSVATAVRELALGVVLSGSGKDGTMGAMAIREVGGTVLVESPETAEFSNMPSAVVLAGAADEVLERTEIGRRIGELVAAGATA